ncbi:Glycoside hydrolase [Flavobacterium sp. 9AF]|uniref:glycosyl hydrolase family 18 protein n=1 Tax=Flavobacterium sp. 9AF TaxID=2653142 RepID=UPI0012F2A9A6|nr:glycosyl hydrolase family 18 protein [Flavobacterium sp. 9AF]VXB98595.1 Glycoside hydrolase [Flavobacterium sp. 9AF]
MVRNLYYLLSFFLICPLLMFSQPNHNKKVVGYYAQWAIYARDFNVNKIDGNKLTHLMYAFFGTEFDPANPQSAKIKSLDTYADFEHTEGGAPWNAVPKGNFYDLMQLKQTYPHLKILISIGGWTKSQDLPGIAASPVARTAFAQNMANFLTTYPFIDGFDIDWEFPIIGGIDGTEVIGGITPPAQPHTPNDHKNLVYLLKEMRLAMPNKIISIAAGNNVVHVPNQFIGPGNKAQFGMQDDITTYCDFITFFGYDLGGNWYDKTCYNAPLYGSGNANDPLNANNESLDHLTNIYLNTLAIPNDKLVMGIPFYGKIFGSVANNGTIPTLPGLFVSAPRTSGSCTNPQAPQGTWDNAFCEFTGSVEFCDLAGTSGTTGHHYLNPANSSTLLPASSSAGWVRYWDSTAKVPYLYNATTHQFVTYDDKVSIDEKAKYIKQKNLGGAMIWELSQDTRPGSPEPAALLGQINTTFSTNVNPPATVNIALLFKDNSNNPISGVTTVLTKSGTTTTVTQVSDANGNVQFPNTATNAGYVITYTKNTYNFTPQTTTIANGSLSANTSYTIVGSNQTNPTYSISGSVKNGVTGLSGITVTLTGNGSTTSTTTNSSGNYSFANVVGGQNYTIAASNVGQTFLPSSASFSNLNANKTQDFTLQVINTTYLISGTVKNGTVPVAGAKVDLILPWTDNTHNWVDLSTLTDAQGNYHFENAALSGYNTYLSLKLNAWENNNVTYFPSYTQGNIPTSPQTFNFNTQTVVNTTPVVNITAPTSSTVSLNLGSAVNFVANVGLSANDGTTITSVVFNLDGQNLTVSNSSSTYNASWTPTASQFSGSHVLKVTATASNGTTDEKTYNFTLTCSGSNCPGSTYSISGSVKNGVTGLSGITVTLTGNGSTTSTTTNSSGNYSFANVVGGQNYTIAASNVGQTFLPSSASFSNLNANKTQDFTLQVINTTYLISGTVKNGTVPVAGAKVDLILPWTDNTHNWVDLSTLTDAQGNYHFENAALSGYNTYLSLKLNAWENNNVTYFPSYTQGNIPTSPQTFNFNTQTVVNTTPVVNITAPTSSTVSLNLGSAVNFVANVGLSANDGTTITSVVFNLDGQNLTVSNSSSAYNASWTPTASQFSGSHVLKVTATASNGTTDEKTYNFTLTCSGSNCPNQLPVITWNSPSNTTIYQSTFQTVPISVTATDSNGSISSVTITINGSTSNMTAGTNGTYTYNFLPTAYQSYPIVIKATDNASGQTTLNNTITISSITNNRFIPLPQKVVLGYAHSWENAEATFLYFNQMIGKKFNVVAYAFIETVNRDGYTPVLTTNDNRYLTNGVFDKQLLKNDIKALRDSGIPVIVSIGGQNGHVVLQTVSQKNTFVNGLKAIIDEYQFDGVDIDFEGGSMDFGAAGLTDFSYAGISPYPRLKNVVDAFKELKQYYGPGFILTAAPETFYVQVGYQSYGGTAGSFLPVLHNLRTELDLLMVQLYNSGPVGGLDNQNYFSATPNFITSMTDMLLRGFNVGTTGFHFDALPPSKVVVALPACQRAAGTGYLSPTEGIKALNYLRYGTTFSGRTYTMQPGGPYPGLRGVMTWSVNWDAAASCASAYEFSNAYGNYFAGAPIVANRSNNDVKGYIAENKLTITSQESEIKQVNVYNLLGQLIKQQNFTGDKNEVEVFDEYFSNKQIFIIKVIDTEEIVTEIKVY